MTMCTAFMRRSNERSAGLRSRPCRESPHELPEKHAQDEKTRSLTPSGASFLLRACFVLLFGRNANASDWPQLLGPTRDAVYAGTVLSEDWPKQGPPVLWQANVGEGYSN